MSKKSNPVSPGAICAGAVKAAMRAAPVAQESAVSRVMAWAELSARTVLFRITHPEECSSTRACELREYHTNAPFITRRANDPHITTFVTGYGNTQEDAANDALAKLSSYEAPPLIPPSEHEQAFNALCVALGVHEYASVHERLDVALKVIEERESDRRRAASDLRLHKADLLGERHALTESAASSLKKMSDARRVLVELQNWHEVAAASKEVLPPQTVATMAARCLLVLTDAWFTMPEEVRNASRS